MPELDIINMSKRCHEKNNEFIRFFIGMIIGIFIGPIIVGYMIILAVICELSRSKIINKIFEKTDLIDLILYIVAIGYWIFFWFLFNIIFRNCRKRIRSKRYI